MKINEIRIENWAHLLSVFEALKIHKDGQVWYLRGQANYEWFPTSSLCRQFKDHSIDKKKGYGIEMAALHNFQSQAHLHISNEILSTVSSIPSWWMLMQHYSCPTRLVDWTSSPYVATYFAVEQQAGVDGAIWFFAGPILDTLMTEKYGEIRNLLDGIIEPEHSVAA